MAGYVLLLVATSTSGLLTEGEPSFQMIVKRGVSPSTIRVILKCLPGVAARRQLWSAAESPNNIRTDSTDFYITAALPDWK